MKYYNHVIHGIMGLIKLVLQSFDGEWSEDHKCTYISVLY